VSFRFCPDPKEISGCGLTGFINKDGRRVNGEAIMRSMEVLRERGNGLGGGFAIYGLYPDYKDFYAYHVMCETEESLKQVKTFMDDTFYVEQGEPIKTRQVEGIVNPPILWRFFVKPKRREGDTRSDDDYVVDATIHINRRIEDAYVFSCGKNMAAFKGVGFPEDIGRFFRIEEYEGYLWVGHSRFPTNTPGWWGGAHPFTILDWAVVHNGEISSYGINKRYLEMFGYACTLMTDTEVVAYTVDLLIRRHKLPLEIACAVMAPPLWAEIERMPAEERRLYKTLRMVYGSLLLNGPFAFIISNRTMMVGLNDRIKLRPLVAAIKGETLYISSEECGIREICPDPDELWLPQAGKPVVGYLNDDAKPLVMDESELKKAA
jgi:glutamate synthase domain-containing protein 1